MKLAKQRRIHDHGDGEPESQHLDEHESDVSPKPASTPCQRR